MLKIEIEEYDNKDNEYPDVVGYYNYKIYYDDKLLQEGQLEDVLKIRELNAIIFCLDKVVNGEMFDD
jgi:hypothetical protein